VLRTMQQARQLAERLRLEAQRHEVEVQVQVASAAQHHRTERATRDHVRRSVAGRALHGAGGGLRHRKGSLELDSGLQFNANTSHLQMQ
jgi:hypothetical protein